MPLPRGARVRVKRTGKTTGERLAFAPGSNKVIETKKLRHLKGRKK
jgi:hypothetical protein